MDVDMDDSLLSLVGDAYNTPDLGDEPFFAEYDSNNIRASLGSSDPVDENEHEEATAEGHPDEVYYDEFDEYADSEDEEMTADEGEDEGDITVEAEEEDANLSDGEFAEKADSLAGIIEVTEKEAKSLRRGPAITHKEKSAPVLELAQFKALINHHLAETEWKYTAKPEEEAAGKIRVKGVRDLTRMRQLGESLKQL